MRYLVSLLGLALAASASLTTVSAQSIDSLPMRSSPVAATSATVVPMLVRYEGVAPVSDSKAAASQAGVTFLIYKDEKGGEPLWIETQNVVIDAARRYQVYLGSTYASGLPPDLFGSGEARWLEVQFAGEAATQRTLLSSVPYALKASDAATLGGLPASAFVLAPGPSGATSASQQAITPNASASNVTTVGGTSFYVPRFNTATSIINSQIYDNGKSVGIGGIPNASAKLDVSGAMIMRGNMQVTRTGNATTSQGYPSYGFQFYSNAYNSSSKATDNPYFQLQSEPTGNNTSAPSATFNLLFSNNGSKPAETGFSINPDGSVNFTTFQTFTGNSTSGNPGVYGTSGYGTGVSGISESGDGVYGSTTGITNNTAGVYGKAGSASGFSGVAGLWGDSYSNVGVFGTSYKQDGVEGMSNSASGVQGISTSGTGVAGTSTSANGVLGYTAGSTLNTAGVTGQAGGTSGFTGIAGVWGDASTHVGVLGSSTAAAGLFGESKNGPGVQGSSTNSYGGQFTASSNSAAVYAVNTASSGGLAFSGTSTGTDGVGLYVNAEGKGGVAIEAIAVAGNDSNGVQPIGVYASSTANGVLGSSTGATLGTAGVLGVAGARTGIGGIAGVWGDAQEHVGVIGSSNDYSGVYGSSANSFGIQGFTSAPSSGNTNTAGVYGSARSSSIPDFAGIPIGVWGDVTGADEGYAVVATSSGSAAGYFTNNGPAPTLYLHNFGSGPTQNDAGAFHTLEASTANGTCGFGGNGDMTCTGQVKSLATTGNGTRMVETYSMQSPENWMEDFGSGTLRNGSATVSIDAAFAETVSGSADYHVFLTPRGDSKGLYVTNLTASTFEVRESGGGASSLAFDYRIVARRKGFEKQRMVDVTDAMNAVKAREASQMEQFKKSAKAKPAAE